MRKYTLIVLSVLFILLNGCNIDRSVEAVKHICLDWGSTRSEVTANMDSPEPIETETSLFFTEWNGFDVVAYQFTGAFLTSTLALLPDTGEELDVVGKRYLKSYTHLGYYSGTEVYSNENANSLAIVYPLEKDGSKYIAIGWSMLSEK